MGKTSKNSATALKINQLLLGKFCLCENSSSDEWTKKFSFSTRSDGPKWQSLQMWKPFNTNNKDEYPYYL